MCVVFVFCLCLVFLNMLVVSVRFVLKVFWLIWLACVWLFFPTYFVVCLFALSVFVFRCVVCVGSFFAPCVFFQACFVYVFCLCLFSPPECCFACLLGMCVVLGWLVYAWLFSYVLFLFVCFLCVLFLCAVGVWRFRHACFYLSV